MGRQTLEQAIDGLADAYRRVRMADAEAENLRNQLAKLVARTMKDHDLSLRDVATPLGVHASTVAGWLRRLER